MMRKRIAIIPITALVVVAITLSWLAVGASSTETPGIVVTGADSRLDLDATASNEMENALGLVMERVFVQWANTLRHYELTTVPQDLQTVLDAVSGRLFVQWANSMVHHELATMPNELETELDAVAPRLFIQWANSAQHLELVDTPESLGTLLDAVPGRLFVQWANSGQVYDLTYPCELFGDSSAPVLSEPVVVHADGITIISWSSDELATSTVRFGTKSGVYDRNISSGLYATDHSVELDGLIAGQTYYYRVGGTDRCDYTAESQEYEFEALEKAYIYLPLITNQ